MNSQATQRLRDFFSAQRQRIAELEEEAEELRSYHSASQSHLERRLEAANQAERESRRRALEERSFRDYDIQQATKALERAQGSGDEYAISQAVRRLKNL